jgi:hypothetical protein
MTHRADFEFGTRRNDTSKIGGSPMDNNTKILSEQTVFEDISTREIASAYSRSYKYTRGTHKTKNKDKIINYTTENLAETMRVVHAIHKYGDNVKVESPKGINRNNKITAEEWKKTNPELYEIGEKLYNSKSYDEFKSILIGGES